MKIGNVIINGPAALAPMAGVADRAFRELCVSFGASYVVSEMVSAKGLEYHNQKTGDLMELSDTERPAGIQLFGGLSGDADAAVADYLAGQLVFDPDIHCTHHDHDEGHSCGSHCGGGCH